MDELTSLKLRQQILRQILSNSGWMTYETKAGIVGELKTVNVGIARLEAAAKSFPKPTAKPYPKQMPKTPSTILSGDVIEFLDEGNVWSLGDKRHLYFYPFPVETVYTPNNGRTAIHHNDVSSLPKDAVAFMEGAVARLAKAFGPEELREAARAWFDKQKAAQ